MRITRRSFRVGAARYSVAYVTANWFERRAIKRMMLDKRHNLRPAHNWLEPSKHGASFVMRRKGASNADYGPDPTRRYPILKLAIRPEFSWLDFFALAMSSTLWIFGHEVVGWIVAGGLGTIAIYLRYKFGGFQK